MALEVGDRMLPQYGHRFSRRDFTQPQLFACLVLRKFFNTDYRRITAYLDDWPTLQRDLKLAKVPHFTTLQKAETKLLRDPQVRKLLSGTVAMFYGHDEPTSSGGSSNSPKVAPRIEQTASDSTGFETTRASRYFIRRRQRGQKTRQNPLYQTTTYRRFAKRGITVDCDHHLILATHRTTGPHPDVDQLKPLMAGFVDNVIPTCMLLDAGYDSEANHRLLRETLNCESWIPPTIGRPTDKLPSTKWRYLMATAFDEEPFGQRWQSETVMYMLKQHQGEALTARKYQTRRREMGLMCITHNIMIVYLR